MRERFTVLLSVCVSKCVCVCVCVCPPSLFQEALSIGSQQQKKAQNNNRAFCFPPHSLWHTLRLFKFVMPEWIINEDAWQPRSKPSASSCTLYLLGCLSNIRTGPPQTETRQKRVTRQVLPPGEREAESVGVRALSCLCAGHCVCVCVFKKRKTSDTREPETDLLKQ